MQRSPLRRTINIADTSASAVADDTDDARDVYYSGYATWFTAEGAIRIGHYDVIGDVITRKLYEIAKSGDHIAP